MAGLDRAIHAFGCRRKRAWMPGSSPGMTSEERDHSVKFWIIAPSRGSSRSNGSYHGGEDQRASAIDLCRLRDARPLLVGLDDVAGNVLRPGGANVLAVVQIELAVDDRERLGVDVGLVSGGGTVGAEAAILRQVARRIRNEAVARGRRGEIGSDALEAGSERIPARHRPLIRAISDRFVA